MGDLLQGLGPAFVFVMLTSFLCGGIVGDCRGHGTGQERACTFECKAEGHDAGTFRESANRCLCWDEVEPTKAGP